MQRKKTATEHDHSGIRRCSRSEFDKMRRKSAKKKICSESSRLSIEGLRFFLQARICENLMGINHRALDIFTGKTERSLGRSVN